MLRKQFLDEVEAMRRGEDPSAVVREQDGAQRTPRTYVFQSIRPENVRHALEQAMGLKRTEPGGGALDVPVAMPRRA